MAQARDLYEVLGVPRDASADEIRRAYRRLARTYHPDVNKDPQAEHRFREINLAYETLSDPVKRRRYDTFGGEGLTPDMFLGSDLADLFTAFFGGPLSGTRPRGGATRARRGDDVRLAMDLTFEEAMLGTHRDVEVRRLEGCERCGGTGSEPGTFPSRCTRCGGTGEVADVRRSVFGTVMTSRTCTTCGGTGEEIASPCRDCRGEGRVVRSRTVPVDVPPGVEDGLELHVEGAGEAGRAGGPPGRLVLELRVPPHPLFDRRGDDLVCTLEVPVTLAMLGGKVEIDVPDGREVIQVPPGTRAGEVVRLRGRGVPHLGRRGRGDLLVEIDLAVPGPLGRKQRKQVEDLALSLGEPTGDEPAPGRLRPRG